MKITIEFRACNYRWLIQKLKARYTYKVADEDLFKFAINEIANQQKIVEKRLEATLE